MFPRLPLPKQFGLNGYKYGHVEGFQKGLSHGIKMVTRSTAQVMKQQGYSDETITLIKQASLNATDHS